MAHVFVVDDDASVRTVISQFLQMGGHSSEIARSGFKAIQLLAKNKPDLILTDLSMPGMNSLELRAHCPHFSPEVPCALLTGHLLNNELGEQFDAIFEKPLRCSNLLETVTNIVRKANLTA